MVAPTQGQLFGWHRRPDDVKRAVATFAFPDADEAIRTFGLVQSTTDTYLYQLRRKMSGQDPISGPQQIGDCTSWMGSEFINSLACCEAYTRSQKDPSTAADFKFEETATEATYATERIDIGKGRLGGSDGGVGAWVFQAFQNVGTTSRPALQRLGYDPTYSGKRAKQWGDQGLPTNVHSLLANNKLTTFTNVTNFDQAVTFIDNGYPVGVCSNRGFEEQRDQDGFCNPKGEWDHAMLFVATKKGSRPGLGILQWWGLNKGHPNGPAWQDAPGNFWWVDADVANSMLAQGDSHTGNGFQGYESRHDVISVKWAA